MRIFIFILLAGLVLACGKTDSSSESRLENDSVAYDSSLAKQLGADDYGMKIYYMAFLRSGPERNQDSAEAARLQRAHLDNISRLAGEDKLVLAGPFLDQGDLRGIYIFNVTDLDEAQEIAKSDPAVQAGRLILEFHPWYGSAALMKVNEIHEKIGKIPI